MNKRVAVIDIGSNSIKALVAESDGTKFWLNNLFEKSLEVRIGKGISGDPPTLNDMSIQMGVDAVANLHDQCKSTCSLSEIQIVATSAVRNAVNGMDFMEKVRDRTGVNPTVLTGRMEAEAIAYGVRTDPAIDENMEHFSVFDLGGGSLELIRFENKQVVDCISLPLGSVRLTEQFINNPHSPVLRERADTIMSHIAAEIADEQFKLSAPLIGCSGGLTTWRAIRAKRMGVDILDSSPEFTEADIDKMIQEVVFKTYRNRIMVAQIPVERADIFPVTLLTFKALMEIANVRQITHSLNNLRYGIAWRLLQA